jgi:nucleoside-diphosphate-sugar epimerase
MKILITGGTGFIGRKLVEELTKKGHEVVVLARRTSNIQPLKKWGVKFYFGDLRDKMSLRNLPPADVVYHLAAVVHSAYETLIYETNVKGTTNLIEICLKHGIDKFIFTSSIAAIGLPKTKTGLVTEEVEANPITPYGKSKLLCERILIDSFEKYGFPVIILRPPTVYGPGGETFSGLIRFVKKKIDKSRPIFYPDRGQILTSLCYIDNLIEALILASESKLNGEIFNVDDGRPYTVREIINEIAKNLGGKPIEFFIPVSLLKIIGEVNRLLGTSCFGLSKPKVQQLTTSLAFDCSKIKRKLHYCPKVTLKQGIRQTVQWYLTEGLIHQYAHMRLKS